MTARDGFGGAIVDGVKACVFDVFGTVVDWRGSLIRDLRAFGASRGLDADWERFTDSWRNLYRPSMDQTRRPGKWLSLDALHRQSLERLLVEFGPKGLSETDKVHMNDVWERLTPWPDSVPGLRRLKQKVIIAPLSNANVALLTKMAKHAGLPWDCILSAELAKAYKPDPAVYRSAPEFLRLRPDQVMMVAAHPSDLVGAAAVGLKTAYVRRPLENISSRNPDGTLESLALVSGTVAGNAGEAGFDLVVDDLVELADRLGA